jgi:hypothetical protein
MIENKSLDANVAKALKDIAEEANEQMPDIEMSWKEFERKIKNKNKSSRNKNNKYKYSLVASIVVLAVILINNPAVNAFKNQVFQWTEKDQASKATIIKTEENPQVKEGTYKNLSFLEAQNMAIFGLKKLEYVPNTLKNKPKIEAIVSTYPLTLVKIAYENNNNQELLSFEQENTMGKEKQAIYVPENIKTDTMNIDHKKITIFYRDNKFFNGVWNENGIKYSLTASDTSKDEFIKMLENIR